MKNNITILFYINSIKRGGAERVISQLANTFSDNGYTTILLTSFIDENEYILNNNVIRLSLESEKKVQSRLKKNISRIKLIREICKENNVNVLVSFMAEPNYRALVATLGLSTKTVISVRNDPQKEYAGFLGKFLGTFLLPIADGCVFQTKEAQQWFPVRLQKKSKIIFNQVDEKFFRAYWRNGKKIVTLGRLTKQKNQIMLIKAFNELAFEFKDIYLEIYGEGELKKELQAEINQLPCRDRIVLKGITSDPVSVLEDCAMFVLSSDFEGMPNALLEALAVGVPCISTDCPCGGPRSIIRNEKNGILINVNDMSSLVDSMRKVLNNNEYSYQLANNAKKSARIYSPNKVFREWENFVLKICNI